MDKTIWIVLGVFAALIALIAILKAVRTRQESLLGNEQEAVESASKPAIANRAELVAVAASCIAEVMGKDISGLRIVSIKQAN
ncbi:MAG: hypothetical protein Q8S22_11975 [Eubacteriales bacterium]|jgi:hypothetical protein|nr:hypothetical protein [Eubacteriales bacterium]